MAGFFGLFDYSKPGPGIDKETPQKHRFFVFFEIYFRKFWPLCAMNALYLLCCIPVVTFGPATAGFTYILRNFSREEHAFLWMDFKDTIKKNWKQSLPAGIINFFLAIALVVAIRFWYLMSLHQFIMVVPLAVCVCCLLILIFMQYYLYVMMITFKLSLLQIYKNALIFAFVSLPQNMLITLIVAATLFFTWLLMAVFPILGIAFALFVTFSFCGMAVNFIVWPVIKKYMINPYYELHPEETAKQDEPAAKTVFEDRGSEGGKK